MYSLTKGLTNRRTAAIEVSSFAASLAVAHVFFKFGSFMLELSCFLALWWAMSGTLHKVTSKSR